jgi:hypothetical protein
MSATSIVKKTKKKNQEVMESYECYIDGKTYQVKCVRNLQVRRLFVFVDIFICWKKKQPKLARSIASEILSCVEEFYFLV